MQAANHEEMVRRWGAFAGLAAVVACLLFTVAHVPPSMVAWFAMGTFLAILLIAAAVALLRALAFTLGHLIHGAPELHLSEVPIVPGRSAAAAVRTARPLQADRWALRLQCFSPIGSMEHRAELMEFAASTGARSKAGATWRGELLFDGEFAPSGPPRSGASGEAMLPVLIDVPAGAPPSSEEPGRVVRWVLLVKAASFPFILTADFDLPVFYAAEGDVEHLVPPE